MRSPRLDLNLLVAGRVIPYAMSYLLSLCLNVWSSAICPTGRSGPFLGKKKLLMMKGGRMELLSFVERMPNLQGCNCCLVW